MNVPKTGTQNWIGKVFLMVLAGIWLISDLYPHIMKNFFLTEREVPEWGTINDWGVLSACAVMIVGGIYLNKLLEAFVGFLGKFTK
jgi:hypothetical protein